MAQPKKRISVGEFVERIKGLRKRPLNSGFIEKFNKIMEEDERHDPEKEKSDKRTARPTDVEV